MIILPQNMTVFLLLVYLGVLSLPAFGDTTKSSTTFKKEHSVLKNATIENVHQTPSNRHKRNTVQGRISTHTTLYAGSPLNDPEATFYHLEQEFFKDDSANQKWLGEYPRSAEVRLGLRTYQITENASLFVSAGYGVLKSFREQPYDTGTLRLKRNLPFVVLAGRSVIPARDFVTPRWLRGLNFFMDIAYYLPLLGGTVTLESATYKREYR